MGLIKRDILIKIIDNIMLDIKEKEYLIHNGEIWIELNDLMDYRKFIDYSVKFDEILPGIFDITPVFVGYSLLGIKTGKSSGSGVKKIKIKEYRC